jgi:hypothetical protein
MIGIPLSIYPWHFTGTLTVRNKISVKAAADI